MFSFVETTLSPKKQNSGALADRFSQHFFSPSAVAAQLFCKCNIAASCTAKNDCDWFKEIQTSQGLIPPPFQNDKRLSQTFLQNWHSANIEWREVCLSGTTFKLFSSHQTTAKVGDLLANIVRRSQNYEFFKGIKER